MKTFELWATRDYIGTTLWPEEMEPVLLDDAWHFGSGQRGNISDINPAIFGLGELGEHGKKLLRFTVEEVTE